MEMPAEIDAAFESLEGYKAHIADHWSSETQAAIALNWTQSTLNRLLKTKRNDLNSTRKGSTFVKNVMLLGMSILKDKENALAASSEGDTPPGTTRRPFLVFGPADDPIMAFYPDMINGKWVLMGEVIKPLSVPVGEKLGLGFLGQDEE